MDASYLVHYGVLGMRWGKRKKTDSAPSAHRTRLEAKYLARGLSKEEAGNLADKRIRGEKYVAMAAGAVALAGAAYIAKRELGKRFASVTIEAGKDLHYINALGDSARFDRRLYTSFEKGDVNKYKGMLATALRKNEANTTIYDTVLKTTETIRAPSHQEAKKLFDEYRKQNTDDIVQIYANYKSFNTGLASGGEYTKKFYDFMRSKGYNAILDANDQFVSGYGTKKPLIIFNASSSLKKVGQSVVKKQLSDRLNAMQMAAVVSKQMAPMISIGAAYAGGMKLMKTTVTNNAAKSWLANNKKSGYSLAEVYNAVTFDQTTGKAVVDETKLK